MSYKRAAVLIIKNKEILLMHRIKNNNEYYAIIGGTIDSGETPEQTAVREIKEETNLDIELGELLWKINDGVSDCNYFLCKSFSGEIKLGGPELEKNSKENLYGLKWVPLKEIPEINLKPELIVEKIQKCFL